MTSTIERKVLADQLETRLRTLVGVTFYRGEVDPNPPVITTPAGPDPSGRIAPYVVLYTGAGTPGIEPDLGDCNDDLSLHFYLSVAAGYEPDCLHTVDRVHSLVYRWAPTVSGLSFGRLRPPPGYEPGPPRRADQVKPPRFWVPLQYRLDVTA